MTPSPALLRALAEYHDAKGVWLDGMGRGEEEERESRHSTVGSRAIAVAEQLAHEIAEASS